MRTEPEREMVVRLAFDVEQIRALERVRIPVGSPQEQEDCAFRRDVNVADLERAES